MNSIVKHFSTPSFLSSNWIDNLFNFPTQTLSRTNTLNVDIYEKDNQVFVEAPVPGVSKDDISINVENNTLEIKVESKKEVEKKDVNYLWQECSYNETSRLISLPRDVDTENPDAKLQDGILTVSFKKAQKNKIEIK